jgi:hypothetical protein
MGDGMVAELKIADKYRAMIQTRLRLGKIHFSALSGIV